MSAFHRSLAAHMINAEPLHRAPHSWRFETTWLALTIAAVAGMLVGYVLSQL